MASTEVPFSIRFTRAQVEKIARVAEVEDRSQASVVRRAVDALDDRALDPQTAVTLGQELQFSGGEKHRDGRWDHGRFSTGRTGCGGHRC